MVVSLEVSVINRYDYVGCVLEFICNVDVDEGYVSCCCGFIKSVVIVIFLWDVGWCDVWCGLLFFKWKFLELVERILVGNVLDIFLNVVLWF